MIKTPTKKELKIIKDLLSEKSLRDDKRLFVAEGFKVLKDIHSNGHAFETVVVSKSALENSVVKSFVDSLAKTKTNVLFANSSDFKKVSSLKTPEGILAVLKQQCMNLDEWLSKEKIFAVLCDGIQDPGNMGAIIRTSIAFNVDLLVMIGDSVDIYNPKVVRASSGMILDIPVLTVNRNVLMKFKENGFFVFSAAVSDNEKLDIKEIKECPQKVLLVLGSEGQGVSKDILEGSDQKIYIPINKKVESLNVNSALAIILYALSIRRS